MRRLRKIPMILGLDISTTTIGYTLLNKHGNLVKMGFVKPKGDNLFEKAHTAFVDTVTELGDFVVPSRIIAEKPAIMFQQGKSSAQTISLVLRFNGAYLYALWSNFLVTPEEVMATTARKAVIGKGRFTGDTKKAIYEFVYKQADTKYFIWPVSKTKKPAPERFDMADSYVVAKYGWLNRKETQDTR